MQQQRQLTIGVFGGSFNPIHLGHSLLAITTQQTKAVDKVVIVPVYKHAVKRDLLPFDDRVEMCRKSFENFEHIEISTVEQVTGASNGVMLRELKQQYPVGTKFLWIWGDDFFRWMDKPKGIETLREVSGLIVQRRLHRHEHDPSSDDAPSSSGNNTFFKEPIDEGKVHRVTTELNLSIEYIYGELPHFSSTLVRRAPGHWRSFLTQSVIKYLDERQHLLQQLLENLEHDAAKEEASSVIDTKQMRDQRLDPKAASTIADVVPESHKDATSVLMDGLDIIHVLQIERGNTGLRLSLGDVHSGKLRVAQDHTDAVIQLHRENNPYTRVKNDDKLKMVTDHDDFDEVQTLAEELQRVPAWLTTDRVVLAKRADELSKIGGPDGWLARLAFVEKFNARIDVLIGITIRALTEILLRSTARRHPVPLDRTSHPTSEHRSVLSPKQRNIPELLGKWCLAKEALGRQRAFVCCGGIGVPVMLQESLKLRELMVRLINTKERRISRVVSLDAKLQQQYQQWHPQYSAPAALSRLLEQVTVWEHTIMGCFAPGTALTLVHKLLLDHAIESSRQFEVVKCFEASTTAIDFLLSFSKALAASSCASA